MEFQYELIILKNIDNHVSFLNIRYISGIKFIIPFLKINITNSYDMTGLFFRSKTWYVGSYLVLFIFYFI